MLKCTKCQNLKTFEEMSKDASRKNGISSWCKLCRSHSTKNWSLKQDPEILKRNSKERRDSNFDHAKQRSWMLKYRYGITQKDYDSMLESQNYECAICKRDAKVMTYHLHTDHCHTTGVVRGLLCSPCNTYLGYIRDNETVFNNGIKYLTKTKEENKK